MKDPDYAIDKDKFSAFVERVNKMAVEEFGTDEDGDSRVRVSVLDKTRYWTPTVFQIPHRDRIETDLELINTMRSLAIQAKSASDMLSKELQILSMEKQEEEDLKTIEANILSMETELGIPVEYSDRVSGTKPAGTRWIAYRENENSRVEALYFRNLRSLGNDAGLHDFVLGQVSLLREKSGLNLIKVRVVVNREVSLFTVYGLVKVGG